MIRFCPISFSTFFLFYFLCFLREKVEQFSPVGLFLPEFFPDTCARVFVTMSKSFNQENDKDFLLYTDNFHESNLSSFLDGLFVLF